MDAPQQINDAAWSDPRLVAEYATTALRPPEAAILDRHREALAGRVLELGCGGGRLSGHLLALGCELHGIDRIPTMVEHCRAAYPAGTFATGDLRDLSALEPASFDAVVAGFNVLDVLGHDERLGVLRTLHALLRPGGTLVFSSHNLAAADDRRPPTRLRGEGLRAAARNLRRLPVRLRNSRRARRHERRDGDHALLNDMANDYDALHYCIGRDAQAEQLAGCGFTLIECLDLDGGAVGPGEDATRCHELHYVARAAPAG